MRWQLVHCYSACVIWKLGSSNNCLFYKRWSQYSNELVQDISLGLQEARRSSKVSWSKICGFWGSKPVRKTRALPLESIWRAEHLTVTIRVSRTALPSRLGGGDCISAERWHPLPTSVLDMTQNNLMVRPRLWWSFGECGVPLHCHHSQVHSDPE